MPKKKSIKNIKEKNMSDKSFWPSWPNQKLFYVLLGILLFYTIVFVGFAIQAKYKEINEIGKAPSERDVITISGTGEAIGTPDIAVINVGMVSEGKTVVKAQTDNTTKMNGLIEALKKLGIDSVDLQTMDYSIYPKYEYSDGRSNIIGYQVSQSVKVKIRDLDKISSVLDAAGQAEANQVSGVQFSIDDPDILKEEARIEALIDAKTKAQNIAAALGVSLGQVVGFSEDTYSPISSKYYGLSEGLGGAGELPQVEAGSLDITSNVNVTFEIK